MEVKNYIEVSITNILLSKFRLNNNKIIKSFKVFIFFKKISMSLIALIVLNLLSTNSPQLVYDSNLTKERKPIGFYSKITCFKFIQKVILLFLGVSPELSLNLCNFNNKNYTSFALNYDFTDLFELYTISHVYSDGIDNLLFFFKINLVELNTYYQESFLRFLKLPTIFKNNFILV